MTETWRDLYPFESHYLELDGVRYHYLDEGVGDPLLLVHGNPTWSFYWRNLVTALRNRYRLIVPDHIGCGLSDKPSDYDYRLRRHVGNLVALVRRLDLQNITLVAHDWGGAIGMGSAVDLPDRFARFVLLNTAAFRAPWMPWRIRVCRAPIFGKLAIQGANAFARAALEMATEKPERFTPAVRAGLIAPYDTWSNRRATYEFVQDIPLSARHPTYETLAGIERGLARFRHHPVLLAWGMRDWCFSPKFLDRFVDFFPDAEVERFEDAGHYVVEDAYERIIPRLEQFLDDHSIAASTSAAHGP